jgi:hypothetical protein
MRFLWPGKSGRNGSRERSRLLSTSAAFALAASLLAMPLPAAAADTPLAPTDLLSNGKPCATGASRPSVTTTTPYLAATQQHPTPGLQSLTTSFYWWPVGGTRNETDTVSRSGGNPATVAAPIPEGRLTDGASYAWQARTFDGTAFGPWSEKCQFTVDLTPPPAPGGVTSSDYPTGSPHGGVDVPGVFKVTAPAEGANDIAGYEYTFDSAIIGGTPVTARAEDHGATITAAPPHDGPNRLSVWSKDRAGRLSVQPFVYSFTVRAPAGPAAEWTFDETGDAGDISGHGNTAALSGGAARTDGRGGVGTALSLDGVSAFAATAGPVRAPNPDTGEMVPVGTDRTFTITARVKLSAAGGDEVAAVSADGSLTSAYVLGHSSDRWTFRMAGSDAKAPVSATVSSDTPATAGKWTHLAGVYDSVTRQMRLYVNGVRQASTATLTGGFGATGPVAIGRAKAAGVAAGFLNGAVDDVRVYGYAESEAHLAAFAAPLPPAISFPDGDTVSQGEQLTVRFDAGGDTNVTKFRYSVDTFSLGDVVAADVPGGSATVTIDAGRAGRRTIYAVTEDDAGRRSSLTQQDYTVKGVIRVSGTVWDFDTFSPVEGAAVTLEPGGLSTVTGPDGAYDFTGFPEGHYTLSARKDSACPLSGSVELDVAGELLGMDVFVFRPSDDSGTPTCTAE